MIKRGRKPLPKEDKKQSVHFKLSKEDRHFITMRSRHLGIKKTQYIELLISRDRKRPVKKA